MKTLLGQRIREQRRKKGWTMDKLAEKADQSVNYVGDLERGVKTPSLDTFIRIVEALDIHIKRCDSVILLAFQSATQRAGFGLSFNQSHAKWKIACIATAFGEYRQHGERIYTEALRVLAEAWEGDIDSLRSEVLQGVVRFIALYDHEYDPVRLIRQLKRTSPVTIYRSGQAMSGPNYQKYMHQILKAYNGSSRTKSLPIKQ